MRRRTLLYLMITLLNISAFTQVKVTSLRCEMLTNPLGIDVAQPGFSWQLESKLRDVSQIGYQIIVSSSEQKLKYNIADIWNSGAITTGNSLLISYGGPPLQSSTKYFWKVKVITNKGPFDTEEVAFFTTGLLNTSDWKAKWIGYDKASPWDSITQWSRLSARYLRKEFSSGLTIKRATVYVAGLGMYELWMNGKKIGDQGA